MRGIRRPDDRRTGRTAGRNRLDGDGGTVSVAFVSLALAVVLAIGLVVDGSGRLTAYQRAHSVAGEAARAAAQAVDPGAALGSGEARVDPGPARRAALAYLAVVDVDGTVEMSADGRGVFVTAHVPYRPVLLAGGVRTVSADAQVRLVTGITHEIP